MPVQNLDNNIQIDFDIRTADTVEVDADVIIENAPTIDGTYTMPLIQMAPVITSISKNGEVLPIINKNVNIIVPTKTSDLNNDSNFVTSEELATVATSGDYNDLENTPIIPSIEGLASETFVGNAISTHNTSEEAHQDIRDAIPSIEGLASETFVGNAVSSHNVANDSHSDIRTEVSLVKDIAEGANIAIVFDSYSELVTFFNTESDSLKVGTNLYIKTLEVPDLWISSVESSSVSYTYTTDSDFLTYINNNGQIGYYKFSELETQKVDLSNYATLTDLGGKVSKSGDTMTGNLEIANSKQILFKMSADSSLPNNAHRLWEDGGILKLQSTLNGGITWVNQMQFYNAGNSRVNFAGLPTSTHNLELTEDTLIRLKDANSLLGNYLPLAGGEITGDITLQGQPNTHQYIKFLKNDTSLHCFAIRNPYGGGQIDIGRLVRSTGVYVEGIRLGYRDSATKVTLNIIGGLLYGGDTNDENTRYQMRSDIYKQGIVSQTQTWNGSASTGYSYTMSNPVTGNIPTMFIELVKELGATFNETSGYFEINGLTDVSYEEMKKIYTMSGANISSNTWIGMFRTSPLRTNIFNYPTGTSFGNCTMSNMFAYSSIEVANLLPLTQLSGWTTDDITGANAFLRDIGGYIYTAITSSGNVFRNNERLKHIRGIIRYADSSTNFTNMFNLCYSLETVWLYQHNHNTDFSWSPKLKLDTIQFIVNKRSTASTASAFTITLHPTTYATCQADTTEYTYSGNTYVGIISYAAAKNVSIASA